MEKKVYVLNVDPELRDLIPPLTEEEHQMLEDSIVRDGCDTPLVVWSGTIVDGHNRYEICQKHQVPFSFEERNFANKEAAILWMLEHQLGRRNLNPYQRSEMAFMVKDHYVKMAAVNQKAGINLGLNSAQGGRVNDKLAKLAGVGHDTIKKAKKLSEKANDETKKKLRNGEISIHKAYTDLMNREHEGETLVCECCGLEKPVSEFRLLSSGKSRYPLCNECEKKARATAKKAKDAAARPRANEEEPPSSVTGVAVVNGQLAHVSLGLPDEPGAFGEVVKMLHSAQTYYTEAFKGIIGQYGHSMITKEHNDLLQRMIDSTADTIDDLFNTHIKEEQ